MKLDMLPPGQVKKQFQLQWRPIFSMMEQAPGIEIRETNIDAEYLKASLDAGKEYLKTRVGYCFQNPETTNPMEWSISYWSKKVADSSIRKYGTEQDKSHLPAELSHRNKPRKQHGRSKPQSDRRKVRRHRRLNTPTGRVAAARTGTQNDTGELLPDLRPHLSDHARARGREIDEQTAAETAAEMAAAMQEERMASRFGTAAGDGTTTHMGPRFPLQDRPMGNQRFSG